MKKNVGAIGQRGRSCGEKNAQPVLVEAAGMFEVTL